MAWIFEKKGLLVVNKSKTTEDALMEVVLSAGAEDLHVAGENFEIVCNPPEFEAVKEAIEKAKIPVESAQIMMIPKNQIAVSVESARAVLNLIDGLEEQDDVQNVYVNADITDEVMKEIA